MHHIDFGYVNYNNLEWEHPDMVPTVDLDDGVDRMSLEQLFHTIPQEQLEVLVCLYLGLSPKETAKALHYPNIVRFYNVNAKLRSTYRKQKPQILGYN